MTQTPTEAPAALRHRDRRSRSKGQGLVEFALVLPAFLLLVAVSIDFGRAFYAYVAIENAAKEGAFFGAVNPRCDTSGVQGCSDPQNVSWKVGQDLSGLAGATVTIECLSAGTPTSVANCQEGDDYRVGVSYPFRLVTPILAVFGGTWTIKANATAEVLNKAFDPNAAAVPIPPTPGCMTVPPLVGATVSAARAAWTGAGFTGLFIPSSGQNNKTVLTQDQTSGACLPATTTVTVTHS